MVWKLPSAFRSAGSCPAVAAWRAETTTTEPGDTASTATEDWAMPRAEDTAEVKACYGSVRHAEVSERDQMK